MICYRTSCKRPAVTLIEWVNYPNARRDPACDQHSKDLDYWVKLRMLSV